VVVEAVLVIEVEAIEAAVDEVADEAQEEVVLSPMRRNGSRSQSSVDL